MVWLYVLFRLLSLFSIGYGISQQCETGFTNLDASGSGFECINIDECASEADNMCNHICYDTPGSYLCYCNIGCMLNSNGYTCDDIDECADTHDCSQQCTNLDCLHGRYQCSCNAGYILGSDNHTCIDVNECLNNTCEQLCINTVGSYDCMCQPGCIENGYTCDDINECLGTHDCSQQCTNLDCLHGRYQCSCNAGYILGSDNHTCIDVNECLNSTCEQLCINTVGSYDCICQPGCIENSNGHTCDDIDECQNNNGYCSDMCNNLHCTKGKYNCSCSDGYQLASDEHTCVDINECMSNGTNSCQQKCINNIGSYMCDCTPGCQLMGSYNCIDIDECADNDTNDCQQLCYNEHCTNGSYTCDCNIGYTLNVDSIHCDDIDECESNNGNCAHQCINTEGSYHCSCREGYELEPDNHSCKALPCPALSAPSNGSIDCSGPQVTDQTCTFSCNYGYYLVTSPHIRLCQPDSTWNGTDANCAKLSCPALTPELNKFIGRSCNNEFMSTCDIICPNGYSLVDSTTYYQQTCSADNNGMVEWANIQTCNNIDRCHPNPCQNNAFCYLSSNREITCVCQPYFTGQFCETKVLQTPSLPQLQVGIQSESLALNIASSSTEVTVHIVTDSSIEIWPSNPVVFSPQSTSTTFKVTGSVSGIYSVYYVVNSRDNYLSSSDESYITMYDTVSTGYNFDGLSVGVLRPGCCTLPVHKSYCPYSVQDLAFTSSSPIWSSDNQLLTQGITFVTSNNVTLPVSFVGMNSTLTYNTITMKPISTNDNEYGQCLTTDEYSNCTNWNISSNDVYVMAQYNSLIRSFLYHINDLIPSNITISQIRNSLSSNYDRFNFITTLSKFSKVRDIEGCTSIESDPDNLAYVIRSNADLAISVYNESLSYSSSNMICIALDICTLPQSTIYISLPKDASSLLSSLSYFQPYATSGWVFDILSVSMSSYSINYNHDLSMWNGEDIIQIDLPPHDVSVSVESHHMQLNGFLRVETNFAGKIDMSLQNTIPSRLTGMVTLTFTIFFTEGQSVLRLSSTQASGFLINSGASDSRLSKRDHHETSQFMKGYSINAATYNPQENIDFFSEFFHTDNDQPCPVSTFVHFDDQFLPQWISLYSECLAVKIFGANTLGLTHKITLASSATHWSTNPNTTIRVLAYNYNNYTVKLGQLIGIPNYDTSGSYVVLNLNVNGSITGSIYKATIDVYDTEVTTDVTISSNELSFDTMATLYNNFDVVIKGKILPSESWTASTNIQFNIGTNSFISSLQSHMHRTLSYLANFTDVRLSLSQVNLNSTATEVQRLSSAVSSLQTAYDNSVVNHEQSKQNYENLIIIKNEKGSIFDLFIDQYVNEATRNTINGLCTETSCEQVCQFSSDLVTCERNVSLPIVRTSQDDISTSETVRSETTKLTQHCTQLDKCEYNSGIKWTQYSNGSLKLLPYDGVVCFSVCDTVEINVTVYTDSSQPINETTYSTFTHSWFDEQRCYVCSAVDDCTYKLNAEPCESSNQECDLLKKAQLIASSSASGPALQQLLGFYQDYKQAFANVSAAKGDMDIAALKMELSEQELNITKKAYESAVSVHQSLQTAHASIVSGLSNGIQIRDWVQSRISAPNVLLIQAVNFSTQLPDTTKSVIQLVVTYEIPYLFQTYQITKTINLTTPSHLLMDYISYEVIESATDLTLFGKKRSISKREEAVSLSSLSQFDANCQILNQSLNYLIYLNGTLTIANSDTNNAVGNVTDLSLKLQQRVNQTISASSAISQEYSTPLQQREMLYLTEGQSLYNQLSATINGISMIQWLQPIEHFFTSADLEDLTKLISAQSCYSFVDCLQLISEHIFLDLVIVPYNADSLRNRLPSVMSAIKILAENKRLSIADIQAHVQTIYDTLWTIHQLNYWCSSKPIISNQPVSQLAVDNSTDRTLQCTAISSLPVTYSWYKSNILIPGATDGMLDVSHRDIGTYQCQVRNDIQSVDSLLSIVFNYQSPVLTYTTKWAATYAGDVTGIRIECTANSYPLSPSWKWYYRSSTDSIWSILSTETASSIFIDRPQYTQEGLYMCEANSEYGKVTSDPIPLYVYQPTVVVYRYQFQFTVYDNSFHYGSGDQTNYSSDGVTDQLKEIAIDQLVLKLSIDSSLINDLTVLQLNELPYFKVSFYIRSSNITPNYYQDTSIETLSALMSNELWKFDQIKAAITQNFRNQQMTFDGTYELVNSSLKVGNKEYICPTGHELYSNYLLCVPCSPGQFINEKVATYRSVYPSVYISEIVPKCTACPIGQYQSNIGSTECVTCNSIYTTKTDGAISNEECIALCSPHTYSSTGTIPCVPCADGYYQPLYGARKCISCSLVPSSDEQCLQSTPTVTNTPEDSLQTTIIIVSSVAGSFLILLVLLLTIIICCLVVSRKRKNKYKKKEEGKSILTYVPKGIRRKQSSTSTEAFIPKEKNDKYTKNPLYISADKAGAEQEMQIIKSTSDRSLMKTEVTALSNIDDLSEIEKAIDDVEDDVALLQTEPKGKAVKFVEPKEEQVEEVSKQEQELELPETEEPIQDQEIAEEPKQEQEIELPETEEPIQDQEIAEEPKQEQEIELPETEEPIQDQEIAEEPKQEQEIELPETEEQKQEQEMKLLETEVQKQDQPETEVPKQEQKMETEVPKQEQEIKILKQEQEMKLPNEEENELQALLPTISEEVDNEITMIDDESADDDESIDNIDTTIIDDIPPPPAFMEADIPEIVVSEMDIPEIDIPDLEILPPPLSLEVEEPFIQEAMEPIVELIVEEQVSQPVVVVPHEEPQPVIEVPQPVVKVPQPVVEVPQPVVEVPQPILEEHQPVVKEHLPIVEVPQSVVEVPQPVAEVPQPVVDEPQPVVEELYPEIVQEQLLQLSTLQEEMEFMVDHEDDVPASFSYDILENHMKALSGIRRNSVPLKDEKELSENEVKLSGSTPLLNTVQEPEKVPQGSASTSLLL